MLEGCLKIVNPLGLHARAAAQLVRLAGRFSSRIILKRTDSGLFADAKSILSVLTLAASMGTEIVITVDGNDASEAYEAVYALISDGFGEI
ncbi:MAG TPA: HPr family phosphocarrier protein, partial [Pyrinomonadaceae bacterium]|jgi:phosphocarrier protein HPr|nr:HPr family phosphocarrier protein [Pyrinomonadaceae bacterium]